MLRPFALPALCAIALLAAPVAHAARFPRTFTLSDGTEVTVAELGAFTPILRHLMLAFPDDPTSRQTTDQFLIGTDLLVAPVVTEGAVARDVYLPPGATWFHVWTGTSHAGGQTITVSAPIGQPPVFSRDVDRPDLRAIG